MTLDDETAERIARESREDSTSPDVTWDDVVSAARAGYAARDAEVEDLMSRWDDAEAERSDWGEENERLAAEVEKLRAELARFKHDAGDAWATEYTAARQAEATLAKVREALNEPIDFEQVNDNHAGRALWGASQAAKARAILDESPTEREAPADEAPLKEVAAALSAANERWDPARVTYREHTARYLLSEFKITKRGGSR